MQAILEPENTNLPSIAENVEFIQLDDTTPVESRSATRFARKARREESKTLKDFLIIALALALTNLVLLFIYNGVEQLKKNDSRHELIRKARVLRKQQLLLQYDRNRDGAIDEDEAAFASLNTYQI